MDRIPTVARWPLILINYEFAPKSIPIVMLLRIECSSGLWLFLTPDLDSLVLLIFTAAVFRLLTIPIELMLRASDGNEMP